MKPSSYTANINPSTDLKLFESQVAGYIQELNSSKNFEEIRNLWRKTNIPYSFDINDPLSKNYKSKILDIYKILTGIGYSELNELTSNKLSDADFSAGYPASSGMTEEVANSYSQIVQALRALKLRKGNRVLEFGSGWGILAEPLARCGVNVTAVDIDKKLLQRLEQKMAAEGLKVNCVHAEFLAACDIAGKDFDAIIFHQSFHHSLDFYELLKKILDLKICKSGNIYFFSEPIFDNYFCPWGLRSDGESLWAIANNKWLELGFDKSFFTSMLLTLGLFLKKIPPIPDYVGVSYVALNAKEKLKFGELEMPTAEDLSWHAPDLIGDINMRFSRDVSMLPKISSPNEEYQYTVELQNFNPLTKEILIQTDGYSEKHKLNSSEIKKIIIRKFHSSCYIKTETWCPAKVLGNGDGRSIGVALLSISVSVAAP
jgi:2-polyprenyl-3-methyl-5-hydroxy-6-metoxy-1,4-benzoquinol methylase